MDEKAPLIAAIDVGTNSFHLIIASVNQRQMMQILEREKEMVRLGSGGNDMKYLQEDAMQRGTTAIMNFSKIAKSFNAEIRAVATSAVREALNKEDFIKRVKDDTGVEIEVVSGIEEGRLVYIGCIHSLPIVAKKTLVIDIGGGSTETIIGANGEVEFVRSAKLGAIRLTKRFFPNERISNSQIKKCREFIRGEWAPNIKKLKEFRLECVVGTAGTIQNLAAMVFAAKNQQIPDVLNGTNVTKTELNSIIKKIINAHTIKQRVLIPGIDPARADIIVAGALILEHIINELNINNVVISSYGLREGIVFDTVQKAEAIEHYKHLDHLRNSTIYGLCQQFCVDMEHAEFVKTISLKLFDELQPLHKLTNKERELLEATSMLHDVGYHISHDQHHKHSYYIIANCIMPGFTQSEIEVMANIARYHRKSHPKKKHENFQVLSPEKQNVVKVLASLLRIAEGIDRRKMQTVSDIEVHYNNSTIKIGLIPKNIQEVPDIELWGANRRKQMLEEVLSRKVNIFII